jgi:biopolymer transport protein ExbB/TolQ
MTLERAWFWGRTHGPGWAQHADAAIRAMRGKAAVTPPSAFYARVIADATELPRDETLALELVERNRHRFERFSAAQTTITSAAPLLGILGTVLGIIEAFDLLGRDEQVQDITEVAAGIAEALITTGAGLIVALITLFPALLFRAQAARCQSTIERIAAARVASAASKPESK